MILQNQQRLVSLLPSCDLGLVILKFINTSLGEYQQGMSRREKSPTCCSYQTSTSVIKC